MAVVSGGACWRMLFDGVVVLWCCGGGGGGGVDVGVWRWCVDTGQGRLARTLPIPVASGALSVLFGERCLLTLLQHKGGLGHCCSRRGEAQG